MKLQRSQFLAGEKLKNTPEVTVYDLSDPRTLTLDLGPPNLGFHHRQCSTVSSRNIGKEGHSDVS